MDTKALRQKILDLAIRGKLVPQDPNDEPASVLLERIRAEKQQMVKEGKLKAKDIKNDTVIFKGDDNLHYEQFQDGTVKCIEDEIPFELPDGWAWSRLSSLLVFIKNGATVKQFQNAKGYPITRIETIATSEINRNKFGYADIIDLKPYEQYLLQENDILMSHINSPKHLCKCAIYKSLNNEIVIHGMNLLNIRLIASKMADFMMPYFRSNIFKAHVNKNMKHSVNQASITTSALTKALVPVPPENEQSLIVKALLNTTPLIEEIDNNKDCITELISSIKSKILDLAIRGKLVPQNPNDEPASVLIERIRAEKEELIKAGKIKRDKKESVIFKGDYNSYYQDLPDNWVNIKLSTISEVITKGTTPRGGKVAYADNGIGFLRAENIAGYDKLDLNNLNYVDEKSHNNFLKRSILKANDILITIAGTLGRTAVVPSEALPLNTNQAVAIVRLVNCELVNVKFIIFAINSPTIKKDLLMQSVDMAIPNLSLENISNCTVPLPPLAEQERIVNAVETLFAQIDKIAEQIS